MEFHSAEEFWAALGRLYDSTLEIKGRLDKLSEANEQLSEAAQRLLHATDTLHLATENLHRVAETHERRLDRNEITIEAILEDLRSSREKGTQ